MSVWAKLCSSLRAFRIARGGNVAITFALATLPIITFVGFAVDYSRANSVKVALQSALDSTALMLSKEAATDTSAQLQGNAVKYFKALFTRPEATNVVLSANYTTSGGTALVVNGSANVPTYFLGLIPGQNFQTLMVNGSSTAKWGSNLLRVALVLDNTGSMADSGKMTALISATKSLLTQLQNAATNNGDVYVSINPFVKDVNLGAANYSSNYIYWGTLAQDPTLSDNKSWDANNGTCSRGSAFTIRSTCYAYPVCSKSQYTTQSQCQFNSGTWYTTKGTWTPKTHNATNWNGCVMDRGNSATPDAIGNYDTNATAPSTTINSTLYPAEQYSTCPQAVMGLSYNWPGMTSLVNAMSPNGSTNQAIGLQLGWMSLAGGGPFTVPAMQSGYNYSQVIILLTDGLNTQDRWYGDGSSLGTTDDAKIDAREKLTCANFKAASSGTVTNIIYTIQVNTGGDPTSTLLQNCASTSDKFFLLTSASEIINVFTQIGTNLTQLRVAK